MGREVAKGATTLWGQVDSVWKYDEKLLHPLQRGPGTHSNASHPNGRSHKVTLHFMIVCVIETMIMYLNPVYYRYLN